MNTQENESGQDGIEAAKINAADKQTKLAEQEGQQNEDATVAAAQTFKIGGDHAADMLGSKGASAHKVRAVTDTKSALKCRVFKNGKGQATQRRRLAEGFGWR